MKMRGIITCIAAAMVILIPSRILAQQGGKISFGNLSIIPGVAVDSIYDDNIYKGTGNTYADPRTTREEKKESDWTTHARPSLLFNYILPQRGSVNLGYQGDFAFYNTNSSNNWKNNVGSFNVDYQAPSGLILGIKELYGKSEDPYGSADQYAIGRVTKRWTNSVETRLGYGLTQNFRTILSYSNYKQKYDSDFDYSQNYTTNEFGVSLESRILPKTWGFARYLYGKQQYDSNAPGQADAANSDASRHRASVGLTWDQGAKLSGEVNLGYELLKYDHEFTPAGTRRGDQNSWAAATVVSYQATATTDLGLSLIRTIRNTASDTNESFYDTSIGLNVMQKLMPKLSLKAGVTYGINDYNVAPAGTVGGDPRSDKNYMGNVGLNYDIQQWLGVGVGYNYNRKDSNYETNEYKDNQVMVTVKAVY